MKIDVDLKKKMSDDLSQRLKDFLKRKGSLESPQILAKVPKLENDQVTEEKLDENIESNINDVLMEKIDKIMKKVDRYRSPNQESTLDLNSKLDKLLNVLDEKPEQPKKRTFMSFYGNVMEWSWEGHFDMENFMRNYGVTGKKFHRSAFFGHFSAIVPFILVLA